METNSPLRIYLFSGKRKSGKDFITDTLVKRCDPQKTVIIKISAPIKSHWAAIKGLEYNELLGSSKYKETYRKEMIEWSEKIRKEDYGYFCKAAVELCTGDSKPIWIVSDIRRKTDIKWFKENYGSIIKTVRIVCDEKIRRERGWIFTPDIDDKETECDLDDVEEWDEIIDNSGKMNLEEVFNHFLKDVNSILNNLKS